jgi:hypothetical protein
MAYGVGREGTVVGLPAQRRRRGLHAIGRRRGHADRLGRPDGGLPIVHLLLVRNTMDRHFSRFGLLLAALTLAAAIAPAAGCVGLLTTVAYLVKGMDVPAEYDGLKGKRVAVACQPLVALQVRNSTAAKDLSREISKLLEQRVSKVKIIDQRKVDEWIDENTWDEYAEIGRALKADMVVGVDLEDFNIYQGQTLYQGTANVTLKVIDCKNGDKVVFEKHLPPVVYPPSAGIPASDRQESQFRREFIAVVADQVARFFYTHDPFQNHAMDATALK